MKLVIQTQYKENYGAHTWDGKGECPQYWKFKGGDTFVVPGVNSKDLLPQLEQLIEYSDEASEEYILSAEIMEDDAVCCEEWETPWMVSGNKASRYVKAEDYWQPGYKGKTESYTMLEGGERTDYQQVYIELKQRQEEVV